MPERNTVSPAQVYTYLRQRGVSDTHARGMLANIQAESSFRTGVLGDNNTSGGLFQHHNERFTAMRQAAGENWRENWRGQIDYALSETEGKNYLSQNFQNPADASRWFTVNFERPKDRYQKAEERVGNLRNFAQIGEGDNTDYAQTTANGGQTMVTSQRAGADGDNRTIGERAQARADNVNRNVNIAAGVAGLAYGGYRAARFLLGRRFGLGLLAGNMLGNGDEQAPQPMGFGAVTNNAVGTGQVAMPTTNKVNFNTPIRAKNSGKSQGVDKADVLEKSGDNLKDLESILQDIRDDIRLIVDNTKEKPVKPGETSEEAIRAGFANSKFAQGIGGLGRSAGIGALGMAGLLAAGQMLGDDGGDVLGLPQPGYMDDGRRIPGVDADITDAAQAVAGGTGIIVARRYTPGVTPEPLPNTGLNTAGQPERPRRFEIRDGKYYSRRTGQELTGAALESSKAAYMRDIQRRSMGNSMRARIARGVTKYLNRRGARLVGRSIPFIGAAVGAYDALSRLAGGDLIGVGMSLASAGMAGSGLGTAGAVALTAFQAARDVYNEIYGTEDNPLPHDADAANPNSGYGEKFAAIERELRAQFADWYDRTLSSDPDSQRMGLRAAEESGFYEDNVWSKDEVNLDMIQDVPTAQIAAILNEDDLSASDATALNAELDRRAAEAGYMSAEELEAVQGQGAGAVPSDGVETATDNYQGAMNTSTSQAPIVVPVPQQLASNGNNQAPVTNIFYGDPMTPKFRGAGQYIARELA